MAEGGRREGQNMVLSMENLRLHDNLTEEFKIRQFACQPCYRAWWKKVRALKQVSKCRLCRVKYDPLPPEKQFGIAEFKCANCGNTFASKAQVTTTCQCYRCRGEVAVSRIIPGRKNMRRTTKNRHSCSECNGEDIRNCPSFRPVVHFSTPHDSTGSTRTSLFEEEFEQPLPPRLEGVEEEDDEERTSYNSDD